MEIELDLEKIATVALDRQEENTQFRAFLKEVDSSLLDDRIHALNREVSGKIDCTTCGNCCRAFMVSLDREDVSRLSQHLHTPKEKFTKKYLEKSQMGEYIFSHIPCSFLKGNECSVYEGRPEDCRSYPHLQKKDTQLHLQAIITSYGICPIVFNVLEKLKDAYGFFFQAVD
ncbi:MAG TPA: YkgJ family cysteine cluster protein [Chitinophagaceae bacterium]|nr:YkgJ family cysteine cluster protein [Chitinophagaceae bacterium]